MTLGPDEEFRAPAGAGDATVRSGKPLFLDELEGQAEDASVRVVGEVTDVDIEVPSCEISHRGHSLEVHLGLVPEHRLRGLKPGALFLFIGELGRERNKWRLDARIAKNVGGMDISLYERAVTQLRAFEDTIAVEVARLQNELSDGEDDEQTPPLG